MATCPKCKRDLENENLPCPDCDAAQTPQKKKLKLTKQVDDPSLSGVAGEGKVTTFNLSPKMIGIIVVAVVVIGFLGGLLSGPSEQDDSTQVTPKEEAVTKPSATGTKQSITRVTTAADEINTLFSQMRRANMDEDINSFMNNYAARFPDRAGKKQKTIETWGKYDFASLDFFVFDLNVEGSRAEASVGWEIALLEDGKSKPRLIETTNKVVLEKGGAGWQIVSLQ